VVWLRALRHWRIAVSVFCLVLAAAIGGILYLPRGYTAIMTVAPADTSSVSTSALMSEQVRVIGGVFSFDKPTGEFAIYLANYRSRELAGALLKEFGGEIAAPPFAQSEPRWGEEPRPVSADSVALWLKTSMTHEPHVTLPTYELRLRHSDPAVAARVLAAAHRISVDMTMESVTGLVAGRKRYLSDRLETERDTAVRGMLLNLIDRQERFSMLLASDENGPIRMISAPHTPPWPTSPRRTFLVGLAALVAFAAALAAAALADMREPASRRRRVPAPAE